MGDGKESKSKQPTHRSKSKQKAKSVYLTSDDLDGHFGAFLDKCRKPPALHRKTFSQDLRSKTSMRGLLRRKVASSQMHLHHAAGLKVAADLQLTNTSQRTRRRILPLGEMTIKMTADTNAEAGLPIDPDGDQEADPSPDVEEVTPGAEGIRSSSHSRSSRRYHSSRQSRSRSRTRSQSRPRSHRRGSRSHSCTRRSRSKSR